MDLGQVFTKSDVADYMTSLFTLDHDSKVLDPCFGGGAFLDSLNKFGFKNVTGYEIDASLFTATEKQFPNYNLYRADFLSSGNGEKYDGIIMNPPYVRHEKIDDLEVYGITKKVLKKNGSYTGLPSTANLYMYFIMKSIELLSDNGELIVIFPSSWLKARSGVQFKNQLQEKCGIEEETHISGNIFETDAMVEVLILKLRKNKFDISKRVRKLVSDGQGLHDVSFENSCTIDLGFKTSFHEIARVRRGLSTGWNGFFINPNVNNKTNKTPILSTPKAVSGYRTRGAACDNLFMIKENEVLSEDWLTYISMAQKELLAKKTPKSLYMKCLEGAPWYELSSIDSRGILFSYFVRNDMKFIMNDAEFLARDNFYIIQPKMKEKKLLLFALLNSIYTYIQLECIGKKYGAGLLKLQRYDIESLVFPSMTEISKEDSAYLTALAAQLVETADKQCITEITKVLEKYALICAKDVTSEYQNMKDLRLGEGYGKKCS